MNRTIRGFTLIELLVALAITAIFSLLVMTTYSVMLNSGNRSNATAELQTNARTALGLINTDILSAGFGLHGMAGNRCSRLLTYSSAPGNAGVRDVYPAFGAPQTAAGFVPFTGTAFGYPAANAGFNTDALTVAYSNQFNVGNPLGNTIVNVIGVDNGALDNAAVKVSDSTFIHQGDVDILYLPTRNLCIRMQVTSTDSNNVVDHSAQSPMNAPQGFNGISSKANPPLSPALNVNDFTGATLQSLGSPKTNPPVEVTWSIRTNPVSQNPALYRTVVDAVGNVLFDGPIADNVVMMKVLFEPLKAGSTDLDTGTGFVPWATIVKNGQQSQVGAVQIGLVLRKRNFGNRPVPASVSVLGSAYPTDSHYEYSTFTRTIYLTNVAWGG